MLSLVAYGAMHGTEQNLLYIHEIHKIFDRQVILENRISKILDL